MKKILSVILGLALCCMLAALPVCAEEAAVPVQSDAAEIFSVRLKSPPAKPSDHS